MEALDSAVLVADFLPSPAELIKKTTKEKITISIDSDCINFFKTEAKKNHTKYQTMMNEVLSQYAKQCCKLNCGVEQSYVYFQYPLQR